MVSMLTVSIAVRTQNLTGAARLKAQLCWPQGSVSTLGLSCGLSFPRCGSWCISSERKTVVPWEIQPTTLTRHLFQEGLLITPHLGAQEDLADSCGVGISQP